MATNSAMYRGHISVKHPKRYRRKTAAQMQFAVEDIEIPKGIKHEAKDEKHRLPVSSPTMDQTMTMSNTSPELAPDVQIVMNTVDEHKVDDDERRESRHSILTPMHSHRGVGDSSTMEPDREGTTSPYSQDLCPWTTYHGGMVLEDEEGECVGNEVYFVGLIDILQKYNKRKKLENWIKKIKYEEVCNHHLFLMDISHFGLHAVTHSLTLFVIWICD